MIDKYCPKCGETHPLTAEYWHKNKTQKDGFAGWCKNCLNKNNDLKRGIPLQYARVEQDLSFQGIPKVKMKLGHKYKLVIPAHGNDKKSSRFEGEVIQVDVRHITLRSKLGFAETFLKWDLDKWGYKEV